MSTIHLNVFYSYIEQLTNKQPACYSMRNSMRLLEGLCQRALSSQGMSGKGQQGIEQGKTCGYVQTGITPFHALFFLAPGWPWLAQKTRKNAEGQTQRFLLFVVRCNSNNGYSAFQVEYTVFTLHRQLLSN